MSHKGLFRRFLGADTTRLHFAAHSHHPWPDVTFDAHTQAWEDAAALMDDKWDTIFDRIIPDLRLRVSSLLGLPDPGSLVFAPNTHEFVIRLFSCLRPPIRIVTSDAEFHSFDRQVRRWEEASLAEVVRVASEPFGTFSDRMRQAVPDAEMVYLSQVFYDSGFVVADLDAIVADAKSDAFVVIDGYHGFMALPTDIAAIAERAFYLAGGYKYAMSGEGACLMHCPPGFGMRPVDTGWFAGFDELARRGAELEYGPGGDRFWGATFDPSGLYRLAAVLRLMDEEGITPAVIHDHAGALQRQLLEAEVMPGELIPSVGVARGNFLTFRTDQAADLYRRLHDQNVIVDHRGDRLRVGFGIYHDPEDVERLAKAFAAL